MSKTPTAVAAGLLTLLAASTSLAAISAAEAERLGKDLTPMGAERAGNGKQATSPAIITPIRFQPTKSSSRLRRPITPTMLTG